MLDAGQSDHPNFWLNSKLTNDNRVYSREVEGGRILQSLRVYSTCHLVQLTLACASTALESRQDLDLPCRFKVVSFLKVANAATIVLK